MASEDGCANRDDRSSARNDSPSLTGRVRSFGIRPRLRSQDGATSRAQSTDSRQEIGEDGGDSILDSINLPAPTNQSEGDFRDEAVRLLHPSNPLLARLSAAKSVAQTLPMFSSATLSDILNTIDDLAQPGQTPKAREAVFVLIKAALKLPDLSQSDIQYLFSLALKPACSSETDLQVKTIAALTKIGPVADVVQSEMLGYFNDTIRGQYVALGEARRRAKGSDRPRGPLPEEKGLHQLLSFISTVLREGLIHFEGDALVNIIQGTVYIAEKTTSKIDMKKAVELLQTIILDATIPSSELRSCVEIFCAIANAIPDLYSLTWECLVLLLSSTSQQETVEILLETLALAPTDRHSHTVCGALGALAQLVSHSDEKLPKVGFERFTDSLWNVHFAGRRIRRDCLKTIRSLLLENSLTEEVLKSPWNHTIQIILTAVGDETYIHDRTSEPLRIREPVAQKDTEKAPDQTESTGEIALADDILQELRQLANIFNSHWIRLNPEQRQLVGLFYYKLRLVLPVAELKSLLSRLDDESFYKPGTVDWQNHQLEMIRLFVWDREMDQSLGCCIIQILINAASSAQPPDLEHFHMLILRLLNELESEMSIPVANELANFARSVWKVFIPASLGQNLDRFRPLLCIDRQSPGGIHSESPPNEVALSLVALFVDYFESNASCAVLLFDFLVSIAKSQDYSALVRLQVLRLLTRLRCTENGNVVIIKEPDSLKLAIHVLRNEVQPVYPAPATGEKLHEGEETIHSRPGRTSTLSQSSHGTIRGSLRIPNNIERQSKTSLPRPLWVYPGPPGLPRFPSHEPSKTLYACPNSADEGHSLRLSDWLIAVIDILQQGGDWEVYSYVIVHLPSQLANPSLFADSIPHIKMLRNVVGSQLQDVHFQEAPADVGVKKADIAICLFSTLTMLLGYAEHFARTEQDDMVRAFVSGISGWERTPKVCIQAIAVACHQIPASVSRHLQSILQRMSQIITQSQLSVDILEFLGGLARLPHMYVNFREDEYRLVFAICVKYLEHARDQRFKVVSTSGADFNPNRVSGVSVRSAPSSDHGSQLDIQKDLPQYVFALTHHVITIWFLALRLADRSNHVGYITSNLVWTDKHQNEIMDEQSQVTLDMMHRTAYLDLGETVPDVQFDPSDGKTMKMTWIVGMSVVTLETAVTTGLTQITKRQASGTTYASYQQRTAELPPHHVLGPSEVTSSLGPEHHIRIFPNHVLLQLTSTIAPTPTPMEPICLPDDDITRRALGAFDRNDTVDGYKVGVIYIGPGQTEETEILANTTGSAAFDSFLEGLGTRVRLRDAKFNTQGLNRVSDSDGLYTYAWRDRIAELVFHVPTMMPTNLEADPQCINKKQHIGNDFVKIIFNESGLPFQFDTFSSQFNYVNIIITPEAGYRGAGPTPAASTFKPSSRASYYTIQTVTNEELPDISPTASFKLLALSNLPAFARHLALHSAVFSNGWLNREGGEHISSWRNRLREIVRLRDRFANTGTSASAKFPGAKGTKAYVSGDSFRGRVGMGGLLEEEGVLASLDFSRWAAPNHPST